MYFLSGEEILYFENFNLQEIVTPVDTVKLGKLLRSSQYDETKTQFLLDGFTNGFSLGYQGPQNVKLTSPNLKFRVGNRVILWNKVMKEVKLKRFAGPFRRIPFEYYIQSPIGLVPKGNDGKEFRLIFHLSYPRGQGKSSIRIPQHICALSHT